MDDNRIFKLIVCGLYKWNPFSEEVSLIPDEYWPLLYRVNQYNNRKLWYDIYKPQAELIANIVSPDNFRTYADVMKQKEEAKKSGAPDNYTITTKDSVSAGASANTYFDPDRGLVDFKGNVLISKKDYLKRLHTQGIAISF